MVTLSKYGMTTRNISDIPTSSDLGETNDCGSSFASGASCTISFTLSPTPQGNITGALSVTDDAPGCPQSGSLNGASTDEAQRRVYRGLVGRGHWMISVVEVFGIDLVFPSRLHR